MRTVNVQKLCKSVWEAREAGTISKNTEMLSQMIYVAAAADIAGDAHYEVESDRRLQWLWEIVDQLRKAPRKTPRAIGPLEDTIQFILFEKYPVRPLAPQELAAGELRN